MALRIRPPAVAGSFYERDPDRLQATVDALLDAAPEPWDADDPPPQALIAPHAGIMYSGPIAATAYHAVEAMYGTVERVVLIGPSHRVRVRGMVVPAASAFETPLGPVALDLEAVTTALKYPQVDVSDDAHEAEHSLEVHLPFIQEALGDVAIVPLLTGAVATEDVAEVLEALWGDEETLVVVSSDLSHYRDHATARRLDRRTADAIIDRRYDRVGGDDACGAVAIRGLLVVAERRGLHVRELDLRSSADTAGSPDRVVGYGAFAVG